MRIPQFQGIDELAAGKHAEMQMIAAGQTCSARVTDNISFFYLLAGLGVYCREMTIDTEDTNKYLGANLNVTQLTESDMILLIAKIQRITDREVNAVIRDMEKTQLERERRMIFINGILNVSDGMLQRHGANRFNSGYRGRSSRGNVRIAR